MAVPLGGRPPVRKVSASTQSHSARAIPRNPPESPRNFIVECQTPERQRRSTLTPVGSGNSNDRRTPEEPPPRPPSVKSNKVVPMSHPLFAGWSDASLFESLVGKDVVRLQRKIESLNQGRPNGRLGRRDLLDPAACVRSLVDMVLDTADVPAMKPAPTTGSRSARRSNSDPCEPLRLLCWKLAERAAHLEVLLGLVAELIVGHLLVAKATDTTRSSVADSAGCPWTRIGWVDEVTEALEAGRKSSLVPTAALPVNGTESQKQVPECTDAAVQASMPAPRPTPLFDSAAGQLIRRQDTGTQYDAAELGSPEVPKTPSGNIDGKDVAVQASPAFEQQAACTQTDCEAVNSSSQTEDAASTESETTPARADVISQACQTDIIARPPPDDAVVDDSYIQVSHTAVQASSDTSDAEIQVSVCATTASANAQTNTLDLVEAEMQTDAPAAPKPGGLRERKLNAEEAAQQLASAREKLKLEREAATALEEKMALATHTIRDLRQESAGLRTEVAAAKAAAATAMARPAVTEIGTQIQPTTESVDAQTDPCAFYSHSWQSRPSSRTSDVPAETASPPTADSASQTATPVPRARGTQTPSERRTKVDASVGDEEPLSLILGASSLPQDGTGGRWRDNFGHGMQVLAEQWRSKCEASEAECARLSKLLGNV